VGGGTASVGCVSGRHCLAHLQRPASSDEGVATDQIHRAIEICGIEHGIAGWRALGDVVGYRVDGNGLGRPKRCAGID